MKKIVLILVTSLLTTTALRAQVNWETSLNMGYLTNGSIQFVEGFVDIGNATTYQFNFGTTASLYRDIEVEYKITPNQSLDFTPSRFASNPIDAFSTEFTTHLIGVNGINYLTQDKTTRPYAIFGMALAIFDFEAPRVKTATSMAFRLGIGAKHYFTNRLGLKAQISYNAPLQFYGTGIYAGIGTGGTSIGLSLNSTVLYSQGDFLIGIVYQI